MKCAACDVRLTATDGYDMCTRCATELAEGYQENRKILLARLVGLLMMLQVRRHFQWGEVAVWMEVQLTRTEARS